MCILPTRYIFSYDFYYKLIISLQSISRLVFKCWERGRGSWLGAMSNIRQKINTTNLQSRFKSSYHFSVTLIWTFRKAIRHPVSQLINQPSKQFAGQSDRMLFQSVIQTSFLSVSQSAKPAVCQPVSKTVNQGASQSDIRPVKQSVRQSAIQPSGLTVSQSICHSANQAVCQPASKSHNQSVEQQNCHNRLASLFFLSRLTNFIST